MKNWSYKKKTHSGIYLISYKEESFYIGQSKDIFNRWNTHLTQLFSKTHHNKNLQELFNTGNYRDLSFSIIKLCSTKELDKYERELIKQYSIEGKTLLNISLVEKDYSSQSN
jgi:predicted GIY-YIG superfamily endonuclease